MNGDDGREQVARTLRWPVALGMLVAVTCSSPLVCRAPHNKTSNKSHYFTNGKISCYFLFEIMNALWCYGTPCHIAGVLLYTCRREGTGSLLQEFPVAGPAWFLTALTSSGG